MKITHLVDKPDNKSAPGLYNKNVRFFHLISSAPDSLLVV